MKTIEIEKKIRLEPHHIEVIAQKGQFLKEITFQDRYFDTANYHYTSQNIWLRQRDGLFELKVGIKNHNSLVDRYEEITDEKSILSHLGMDGSLGLQTAISLNQLSCFCTFVTLRKSYKLEDLVIDIDQADFGDLRFQVAEIEMVVSSCDQILEAEQKIFHFIKEMDIDISIPLPGKLTYYLFCKRQEHYQALVQNQVIKPIIDAHLLSSV